jgi:hypothetical protein
VAGEAAGASDTADSRGKEQECTPHLTGRQRAIVPGQETVERCIAGDDGAKESGGRTEYGLIVYQVIDHVMGISHRGFDRERIPE